MTAEGDLVLVYVDNQPAFFARIEAIFADVKPQWFQVRMLVLQIPLVVITWILREPYINGEEFTMGGRPVRMEKVIAPEETEGEQAEPGAEASRREPSGDPDKPEDGEGKGSGKVVSLADRLRNKEKA